MESRKGVGGAGTAGDREVRQQMRNQYKKCDRHRHHHFHSRFVMSLCRTTLQLALYGTTCPCFPRETTKDHHPENVSWRWSSLNIQQVPRSRDNSGLVENNLFVFFRGGEEGPISDPVE